MTRVGRRDWVRITISCDATDTVAVRDVEDAWYAAGCYRHPTQHAAARITLAGEELREWLRSADRPPGTYAITVKELTTAPVPGASTIPTDVEWACVSITHQASRPATPPSASASASQAASKGAAA